MTNICRCGTYQRIREGGAFGPPTRVPRAAGPRESSHEKYGLCKEHETLAPQVHRRARQSSRSGGLALGLKVPFGVGAVQAQGAATEVNTGLRSSPTDTCVIRHRAFGDGAGHAHRNCATRRRGTGV